jgi:endonuclease YncB( thermonuclease family)
MIRRIARLAACLGLLLAHAAGADPCWRGWIVTAEAIDGDTVEVEVAWAPGLTLRDRVRLRGVDVPNPQGPTRAAGEAAGAFTRQWLAEAGALEVVVCQPARDAFGRLLGHLVSQTKGDLGAALVAAGHARPR